MSDEPHPLESWSEITPADSMSGMRKAIKSNTDAARSSLDWSMRTYEIVLKLEKRFDDRQARQHRMTALVASVVALAVSIVAAECSAGLR